MMNRECPQLESFEDLLALQPADPRRMHLSECPRCRARMTAFRAFLDLEPIPQGARIEETRGRLRAAISQESARRIGTAGRSQAHRFWDWFVRPAWKPALGVAMILLAVFVAGRLTLDRGEVRTPVLRNGNPTVAIAPPSWTALDDGSIRLHWHPMEGAEEYRILLYGPDLQEIGTVDAGSGNESIIPAALLREFIRKSPGAFARVAALRRGDRVALSPPIVLPTP